MDIYSISHHDTSEQTLSDLLSKMGCKREVGRGMRHSFDSHRHLNHVWLCLLVFKAVWLIYQQRASIMFSSLALTNLFLAGFLNAPRSFNSWQVTLHPLWPSTANPASNVLLMHAVDEWTQLTFQPRVFCGLASSLTRYFFFFNSFSPGIIKGNPRPLSDVRQFLDERSLYCFVYHWKQERRMWRTLVLRKRK
jgi:hypothetical protein